MFTSLNSFGDEQANQRAAANRRPAGQSSGSGNLFTTVAADRAFPAAVAELIASGGLIMNMTPLNKITGAPMRVVNSAVGVARIFFFL